MFHGGVIQTIISESSDFLTIIAFIVWGCCTRPFSYNEAMEKQEVAKWTIWVPHLFFPDSSCKSRLTTLEDQRHCLIPLSWCLFLPIGPWQQGVQRGSSRSLHVNGTPDVHLPWWCLLKGQYLLSQNPLLLARCDSNFCCDPKYEYVIYFWLSLLIWILMPSNHFGMNYICFPLLRHSQIVERSTYKNACKRD